jgi:L-aminopeptidase/D-esterase-like protein
MSGRLPRRILSAGLPPEAAPPGDLTRHTTLSVLDTNVAVPRDLLRQLGRQGHSSMARAIQPFHTPDDGDILFTVWTGEVASGQARMTAVVWQDGELCGRGLRSNGGSTTRSNPNV